MILKRRFEIVGKLLERDPKSKDIFYEILRKNINDDNKIEELLSVNYHIFCLSCRYGIWSYWH